MVYNNNFLHWDVYESYLGKRPFEDDDSIKETDPKKQKKDEEEISSIESLDFFEELFPEIAFNPNDMVESSEFFSDSPTQISEPEKRSESSESNDIESSESLVDSTKTIYKESITSIESPVNAKKSILSIDIIRFIRGHHTDKGFRQQLEKKLGYTLSAENFTNYRETASSNPIETIGKNEYHILNDSDYSKTVDKKEIKKIYTKLKNNSKTCQSRDIYRLYCQKRPNTIIYNHFIKYLKNIKNNVNTSPKPLNSESLPQTNYLSFEQIELIQNNPHFTWREIKSAINNTLSASECTNIKLTAISNKLENKNGKIYHILNSGRYDSHFVIDFSLIEANQKDKPNIAYKKYCKKYPNQLTFDEYKNEKMKLNISKAPQSKATMMATLKEIQYVRENAVGNVKLAPLFNKAFPHSKMSNKDFSEFKTTCIYNEIEEIDGEPYHILLNSEYQKNNVSLEEVTKYFRKANNQTQKAYALFCKENQNKMTYTTFCMKISSIKKKENKKKT